MGYNPRHDRLNKKIFNKLLVLFCIDLNRFLLIKNCNYFENKSNFNIYFVCNKEKPSRNQ